MFSESDVARVCEAAAGGKLSAGVRVATVTLWGVETVLAYRLNEREHGRRKAAGVGPLDGLGLLDALLKLPAGALVPWSSLAARDQRLLGRGASTQSWARRGDAVERLAVPPLSVDLAVVRSGHARREARDVMPFGAYVPQAIWLDCPADRSEDLLVEAARFGTGVVHWQGRGEPRVLAPAVSKDWRETAAGWQFDEHVYSRVTGDPVGIGALNPLAAPTG